MTPNLITASEGLDEVFDRVSAFDFEIPNPFINHAPMACEALGALGLDAAMDEWLGRHISELTARFPTFESTRCRAIQPVTPTWPHDFSWKDKFGDNRLLPDWTGYFDRALEESGWRDVVRTWVPRLIPGLASAAFHGVIRTSHAVRAVDGADTRARRAELARALGNWACWFRPSQSTEEGVVASDPGMATVRAAAEAAARYVAQPGIFALHGVTGAMALHLLSGYLDPSDTASALHRLEAEHRALYLNVTPAPVAEADGEWDPQLAHRAIESFDPHLVKLVEACQRGFDLSGDPRFVSAACLVTEPAKQG